MTKRKKTICVLLGDVSNDFIMELMRGIYSGAIGNQVHLVFLLGVQKHSGTLSAGMDRQGALHYNSIYEYASMIGADALIVACEALSGFLNRESRNSFLSRFGHIPYVVLHDMIECDTKGKTYIDADNYFSISQCIEHLIHVHGYKKIGFVSGPVGHADARERLRAYRDTMAKNCLHVAEDMIAYGDYSEFADAQVSKLLDDHPGLEAIVFCNDEMAKAGYRECQRRGLVVGKDLAITGFDNVAIGRSMEPPLTTISQDVFRMGELAVQKAAAMAAGEHVAPEVIKTHFHIRASCGCRQAGDSLLSNMQSAGREEYLEAVIAGIMQDIPNNFAGRDAQTYGILLNRCLRYFYGLVADGKRREIDKASLFLWLNDQMRLQHAFTFVLAKHLSEFLQQMAAYETNPDVVKNLALVIVYVQQYIYTFDLNDLGGRFDDFRMRSWFMPEFIRDLVDGDDEDESLFKSVIARLRIMDMNNAFLFLLERPQVYQKNHDAWMAPDRMCLAAYQNGNEIVAYPRSKMPVITREQISKKLPLFENARHLMALSLFSGEVHYGILLCEADMGKMPFLHVIGLQLGILLNFLDLKRKEKIISNELDDMREKNEVLNFLSEYDQLCGLLNRRGFIQRAIRRNRENGGKTAYCVFMDLDHLKEINDTFGHSEGDEALRTIGAILGRVTDDVDLIARIGGDEFVGMFLADSPDFETNFKAKFKSACEQYNARSGKPYYVEASVGVTKFTCHPGLEVSMIIGEADRFLYEAKQKRRASVRK